MIDNIGGTLPSLHMHGERIGAYIESRRRVEAPRCQKGPLKKG